MPLTLILLPTFKKCLNKLGKKEQLITVKILKALQVYYNTNCDLELAKQIAPRFFYKQLRKPFFEAGIERNIRIVIKKEQTQCYAILAGNHDQIKTFLKTWK